MGRAAVPSGASTGKREAVELRDGDADIYGGMSVYRAVDNVMDIIAPVLRGEDVCDQQGIDKKLLDLDGTDNKKRLGANAMLAVGLATARLGALVQKKHLYLYLAENLKAPNKRGKLSLPTPLMNIINGGRHACNNLDIQEFMIVPHRNQRFCENLRACVEVFQRLKKILRKNGHSVNVGDEGGFAPNLKSHREAIEFILESIEKAGYRAGRDISLGLDAAASEFCRDGVYFMEGRAYSEEEMIEYYANLCSDYPIYSIEDGLDEDNLEGWQKMTKALGRRVLLVGDDLFVTNKKIFQEGIDKGLGNAILIKPNQIGTLTETFEAIELAYKNNYDVIISHRSGETGDAFIADLAVATGARLLKSGSASRSDRLEKYNQLLRIEEELGPKALFTPISY